MIISDAFWKMNLIFMCNGENVITDKKNLNAAQSLYFQLLDCLFCIISKAWLSESMCTYTHMHTDRQTHTLLWIKHGREQAGLEKSVSCVDFYFHFYKEFCVTVCLEMPMDASKQPAKNLLPLPLRQTCIRLHTNQVQNQGKCSVRRCLDAAPPCSIAPRPGTDPTLAAKTITTHACTHTQFMKCECNIIWQCSTTQNTAWQKSGKCHIALKLDWDARDRPGYHETWSSKEVQGPNKRNLIVGMSGGMGDDSQAKTCSHVKRNGVKGGGHGKDKWFTDDWAWSIASSHNQKKT